MDVHEVITTQMIKHKQRQIPGHKALMCLLSFGINETRLAAELGVDHSLISIWKRCTRPIPVHRQKQLYRLLGIFLAARQEAVALLKQQGQWDQAMSRLVRQKFREAQRIYDKRPAEFREQGQEDQGEAA